MPKFCYINIFIFAYVVLFVLRLKVHSCIHVYTIMINPGLTALLMVSHTVVHHLEKTVKQLLQDCCHWHVEKQGHVSIRQSHRG